MPRKPRCLAPVPPEEKPLEIPQIFDRFKVHTLLERGRGRPPRGETLKQRSYAVVALGFERLVATLE